MAHICRTPERERGWLLQQDNYPKHLKTHNGLPQEVRAEGFTVALIVYRPKHH